MNLIRNVLIIGAGNIAANFDSPNSANVLTHAHAYFRHPHFRIIGFLDYDLSKAEAAAKTWGGSAFKSLEEVFNNHTIQVVSICSPDEFHFEYIKKCSQFDIEIIFCEKPLALNRIESEWICNNVKTPILLNYSRRFVSEYEDLKKYSQKNFGKFLTGTGHYGKGLLHNGSHMIDFLRFFIGEIRVIDFHNSIEEFYPNDPNQECTLRFFDNSFFRMIPIDCRTFTIFEFDFIFEKGRIKILNSGFNVELFEVKEDSRYKKYQVLSKLSLQEIPLDFSMYNAVENIYQFLEYKSPLKCTAIDGNKILQLCT